MKKLIMLAAALLITAGSADAKWWIFGKSGGEVGLKYLYVNKVSVDETGPQIKVFKETLGTDGLIKITGKASVGKGAVGSVRISLDDKATWVDVKFADNGAFEYAFKPEQGKTYAMLVEVTDTAGKTNKPDETRKELSLSDENIQAKVKETLDAMFDAYNKEDLQKFLANVGENFAGDKAILERAVKRDFDALSSINLRYTLNNVAAGAQGRIFVSVTYNRMVFVNKTGATSTDTGSTEFVFDVKEGKLSLYSMKKPLMFGLSDPDVGTGTVIGGGEGLVIDNGGDIGEAVKTVTWNGDHHFGYNIASDTLQECDGTSAGCSGQFFVMIVPGYISADDNPASAFIGPIPGKSITTATLADVQGAATLQTTGLTAGTTYGLKYNSDYYAIQVVSFSGSFGNPCSMTFKVKAF